MAKVGFTVLIANARGRIGKAVFSATLSGSVVKSAPKTAHKITLGQSNARAALKKAVRLWLQLTSSEKAAWTTYSATLNYHQSVSGQMYHPSPMNVYVGLVTKLIQYSSLSSIPTTPPTGTYAGDPVGISAVGGAGQITFSAISDQSAGSVTELLLSAKTSTSGALDPTVFTTVGFWIASSTTPVTLTHLKQDYLHPTSPIPPLSYAVAWRSVDTTTGQTANFTQLPRVTVT